MAVQDLLNFVLDKVSPTVVDTVLTSNVAFQTFTQRARRITGKNIQYPIKFKKTGTGKSFDGFDLLNTNYVDTTVKMSFVPRNVTQPIVFADTDLASADGEEAVISLMEYKVDEATQELADLIGDMVYSDGTGNSNKDLEGLEAAIKTSGTYGGLDYSTYTTLQSTVDSSTALSALTLTKLDDMYRAISSGNNVPTHIFTTKTIFQKLKGLAVLGTVGLASPFVEKGPTGAGNLIPTARPALTANVGYTELYYNGMPIIADEKCPTGKLYMINIKTWDLITQSMPASEGYTDIMVQNGGVITGQYDLNTEQFVGFSRSKAIRSQNQLGVVSHLVFRGDLVCFNPKRNGKFTSLT